MSGGLRLGISRNLEDPSRDVVARCNEYQDAYLKPQPSGDNKEIIKRDTIRLACPLRGPIGSRAKIALTDE